MSLTLDKMRADIAELLHEMPDAIGLDDNLVDLGLDSMRLMVLALKWQEEGHDIDFSHLAEYFTLRGWWDAVAAQGSAA